MAALQKLVYRSAKMSQSEESEEIISNDDRRKDFIGSEESVLEYEPDRAANSTANAASGTNSNDLNTVGSGRPAGVNAAALGDLIQSRDFVIDFPRIFVLEAGGACGTRDTLFPERLPERSQSSMSFTNAKDWMSVMTNKLEEQHGLRRLRKSSTRGDDMEENLLNVCAEAVKKRRSHSADGRYSSSHMARLQTMQLQSALECGYAEEFLANGGDASAALRQHNAKLQDLTEASYAQSKQRQQQYQVQLEGATRRRSNTRRSTYMGIPMHEFVQRSEVGEAETTQGNCGASSRSSREPTPPQDVAIQIQINGEGVNF